jgi:hypothetical protein
MNRSFLRKSLVVAGCAVIAFVLSAGLGLAASVGQELSNPQLKDANDKPATIPDFGTPVLTVTYADSSAGDYGDPMNDATKAKNYSKAAYRGIGVANMKDSAVPNFVIRKIVRGKIEKYKSVILTDDDHLLVKAWNLGNCKGKSVYILIGKDKKLKYIRYTDKSNPWTKADIDNVLKMMDGLM